LQKINIRNKGMKKTVAAGLGACAVALAFAAKDPVIMTVNGVDVTKSEFEYLYNKNSQQQINPQTLDEYVEMFKLYKMKVADARAEGIDTTAAFLKEIEQYRHDLAAPYLADSLYINQLVQEAYDRSKKEVEAYHIMLFKTRDMAANVELRNRADSLRGVLRNGGDFADLAARFSQDRGSNNKGGRMGWMVTNTYPAAFELAAFSLKEGEISDVVESPVGYHILKGGKRRPARGKVKVSHILKLTQGKDAEGQAKAKAEIDSLYKVVMANPNNFNNVATANSEDRGSARQGGMLPAFGAGEMIAEFDSVAFSLTDGEVSKPVKTAYGYHIIRRYSHEDIPSVEKLKPQMLAKITSPQDPRSRLIRDRQTEKLAIKHKGSLNGRTLSAIRADIARQGLDSIFFADWTSDVSGNMVLATVDGKQHKASEMMGDISKLRVPASVNAQEIFENHLQNFYNNLLVNAEELALQESEPDYRNLLKEYVDGSLLYEVSVRKVWDKAAKDTEGLQKYFEANRDNYKWTEPHVKGYLVQATNDSVAGLVRERASALAPDTLVQTLRKEFRGNISIDRVLVSKGTNAMVDNIVFGGPEVKPSNSKYHVYFMIDPRVLNEPEDASDVKGLVTSDYQNEFQEAWETELRRKYPVKVYDKVLRQVKSVSK